MRNSLMPHRIRRIFIFVSLSLIPTLVFSQDGVLDLSFNTPVHLNPPDYNGFQNSSGNTGTLVSSKILSNGKLLVLGDFSLYQGVAVNKVALLNPNGALDTSFNVGSGPNNVDNNYCSPNMICEQPDGKIIIVGVFNTFNGSTIKRIVRLNPDGTIDTTFNAGTAANSVIYSVKLQSDGKILCGGDFGTFNGQTKKGLVRLNSNGSIDTSFNTGTGFINIINSFTQNGVVRTIDIQDDNKILVGGSFLKYNGTLKINLVRLNPDGSLDTTFLIGNGAGSNLTDGTNNGKIVKLIYDSQIDKIYITGIVNNFNGAPTKNLIRLNLDGTKDSAFAFNDIIGYNGLTSNGYIYDLNLLTDGRLLLGGEFVINTCNNMALYDQNGVYVSGFNFSSYGSYPKIYSISSDSTGIYATGSFSLINYTWNYKASVVKILSSGLTDLSFNPNLGAVGCSNGFVLNGNKILTTPRFNTDTNSDGISDQGTYNERISTGLIKLNEDGSIDANDYANYKNLALYGVQISNDTFGGLVVSWSITSKIFTTGVLNSAFPNTTPIVAPGTWNFNVDTRSQIVQSDGKIIIGGNFRYAYLGNSSYRQRIMRLNSNGSLDTSFNVGKGFNGISVAGTEGFFVNSVQLQTGNKVIAGGIFTDFNDVPVNNIVRLNSNGSIDNTFIIGTGFNYEVKNILCQNNLNKIMVCGRFTSYNNTNANYLIRLNSNGTVDTTFNSPFALGNSTSRIAHIVVQPDGKYIITGIIDGVQILNRLNSNGSIDTTFYNQNTITQTTPNYDDVDIINNMVLLGNNKILLTGSFSQINNVRRMGIAVLNNSPTLGVSEFESEGKSKIVIAPNPVVDILKISSDKEIKKISIYHFDGRLIKSYSLEDNKCNVSDLLPGVYLVKMYCDNEILNSKIIKK